MSLAIFDFNEQPVRVLDREGQPWFVAADVCRVLEIANSRDAVSARSKTNNVADEPRADSALPPKP